MLLFKVYASGSANHLLHVLQQLVHVQQRQRLGVHRDHHQLQRLHIGSAARCDEVIVGQVRSTMS